MFPEAGLEPVQPWHPGYPGWYDIVLLFSLLLGVLLLRAKIPGYIFGFCIVCLAMIVGSILINVRDLGAEPLRDGVLFWVRFFLPFVCVIGLVISSVASAEAVVIGMGGLLMISSLFVLQLQFGTFNRVYASGMTVGSFGQVMLVLFVIGLLRNNLPVMVTSLAFLLFTFSRTAIIIAFLLFAYYLFRISNIKRQKRAVYTLAGFFVFAITAYLAFNLPEFRWVALNRLDTEEIATLNSRTLIWSYALDLLQSGAIPLSGVGFGMTPSLLWINPPLSPETGDLLYFASFHSIFFELVLGMGLLSLPLFFALGLRLWKTWKSRCYLPFLVYCAFVFTQAFDFTLYPPKEVVIWGVLLGIAEGEWILHQIRERRKAPRVANFRSRRAVRAPALAEVAREAR